MIGKQIILLYLNVGDIRPTIDQANFTFPPIAKDFVYKLNKTSIINKCKQGTNTLKGVELTIGIYSEINDSIESSPYAFKIFMPPITTPKYVGEIIHIKSDQKVQCLTFEYDNKYICLFAVIVDDIDVNNNLVILPRSQDGYEITSFGKLVSAEDIEINNMEEIKNYMKTIYNDDKYIFRDKYKYIENVKKMNHFSSLVFQKKKLL